MRLFVGVIAAIFLTGCSEAEFSYTLTEIDIYHNRSLIDYGRAFEELMGEKSNLQYNPYRHFTTLKVDGNNVSVRYIFWQKDYCRKPTYDVSMKDNTIKVVPLTPEERRPQCLSHGLPDPVELNMTLPKGLYTINFWNLDKLMDTVTVEIG